MASDSYVRRSTTLRSYRIEIWVNFDESDIESIKHFQTILTELFKQLAFEVREIRFRQMKDEGALKEPKEREVKAEKNEDFDIVNKQSDRFYNCSIVVIIIFIDGQFSRSPH